jgi:hypothetical protein
MNFASSLALCRRRVELSVALLSLVFAHGVGPAQTGPRRPAPKTDTQEWTDVQLTVPLNKSIDFILLGTLRFGRHLTHTVDERIGFNFSYKVNKYFALSPGYTHIAMQPSAGQHGHEDRLSIAGTLNLSKKGYTVSDRNLFERRFRTPQVDATRYRNRLQLEYPFSLRGKSLTLVVSDEVFYDRSLRDWVRNRFLAGARKSFNRHFGADLYYMRQNDGRSRPGDLNVIGTIFRIRT